MNNKNISSGNDSPGGTAGADGKSILMQAAGQDARISGLLAKLSQTDRERLAAIVGDPQKAQSMLATPQAQELMRRLGAQKERSGD